MKGNNKLVDSAAMHEAGHAVAGVLLDRPFEAVSLEQRRTDATVDGRPVVLVYTVGIVDLPGVLERRGADREAGVLDDATAICNLAGVAAEVAAGGALDVATLGGETDAAYIRECVRNAGGSEGRLREIFATAFSRAVELLRSNWTALNMVADFLRKHRRLSYDDVKVLVEAAREHDAKSRGGTGAR